MPSVLTLSLIFAAAPPAEVKPLLEMFHAEFVAITPGEGKFPASFLQGRKEGGEDAERPQHEVTMKHSFAIGKYEVTQELYEAVMGTNPSRWKGNRNSVEMVSYFDAEEFCRKITTLLREADLITEQETVRLPTESQWEYAARAGTIAIYSFGDDADKLADYAWFTGNAAGNDPPVGAKKPNPWGLYDMHGYLWEWCSDDWHADYESAPADGSARRVMPAQGLRVLRGGSWKDKAPLCTSSYRRGAEEKTKDDAVGFRCVLVKEE